MVSFAVIALLASTLTPIAARAQTPADEAARAHFQSGRLYFEEGAYERALSEFQSAYQLSPRPMMLLNLANTNERLGRPGAAAQNLRDYLAATPDAPDRDTLQRRIENLDQLQAQMNAAQEAARQEELARQQQQQQTTTTTTGPRQAAPSGPHRNLTLPLVAFSVGGAGLIMTAITGPLALSKQHSLETGCGATRTCSTSEAAPANRLALLADIGWGVGVAGAIAGTVLLFVGPGARHHDETPPATPTSPTVRVVPSLSPRLAGVVTEVRF